MPQLKQPSKLYDSCLLNIAENIDSYWLKKTNIEDIIDEKLKSRFDGILNDDAVYYILCNVNNQRYFLRNHLYLLFHKNLKIVSFSRSNANQNISTDFKIFGVIERHRCFSSGFNMCWNKCELTSLDLINLLTPMKKLKILNLSGTNANNQVIQVIIDNCEALEDIDILGCKSITDEYLLKLCKKFNETLTSLNFGDRLEYKANGKTIIEILNTCKNLKRIEPNDLFYDVLMCLSIDQINRINDNLKLEKIIFEDFSDKCIYIQLASKFKMLKILHFKVYSPGSKRLSCLNLFQHLQEIRVHVYCSFNANLTDFLKSKGAQLRVLDLGGFDNLNLKFIAKYCPNLQKLKICYVYSYDEDRESSYNIPLIESLTYLELSEVMTESNDENSKLKLGQDLLIILNKSVNLKYFKLFYSCANVDEEYLKKLMSNLSNSIETLIIYGIDKRSYMLNVFKFKDYILNPSNNLKEVYLNITEEERSELQDLTQVNNLVLNFFS